MEYCCRRQSGVCYWPLRNKKGNVGQHHVEVTGSGSHLAILSRHQPAALKVATHPNQVIADRLCRLPCEVIDFKAGQDCDEAQMQFILI
jgi:hypothetical protein